MITSILDRKLTRDAKQSWILIAAVSAIIAVGIGSFISMMSAYRNLEQTKNHYYGSCRLADFWIDVKKVPEQEVARLAATTGISEIRSRIQFRVMLDFPDADKPIGSLLISLPDSPKPVINNIIMQQGSYFTPGRNNEVIVSDKFASARGIRPGDSLTAILNNKRTELLVVGTAISAEFVYMTSPGSMLDEPGTYGLMWIKRSFAEDSFGFQGSSNSIVGLFSKINSEEQKQLLRSLSKRLTDYGVFSAIPRSQQFSPLVLEGEMTQLRSMAITMPSFFLVVAALILNIMMTRMAEQQRTTIGTLKALGYTNWELTLHFLKYSIIPGLLGGLSGCLFGYLLGAIMTEMYLFYFSFPHLSNMFYPELAVTGIGISVIFAMLGTTKGIWKVMHLEPAEAMRSAPPARGGAVFLENFQRLWRALHTQWQMILRALLRNRGRSAISIFAATIGSAIVLLTFGFVNSLDDMITMQFDKALKSDFHLSFSSELPYESLQDIERLPGVVEVEPTLHVPCTLKKGQREEKSSVTGILPHSTLTTIFDKQNKKLSLPHAGLIMSERLMDKLSLTPGDSIEFVPIKGEKRVIKVRVVQPITSIIGMGVYGDFNWLNSILGQRQVISEIRVKIADDPRLRQQFIKRIKTFPGIEGITDIRSQKSAMVKQQDSLMGYAAAALIGFAAIIFLGTILNTSLIAISERLRDIATFRTMGYHQSEVAAQFLKENLIINLLGTAIGIPLGYSMLISTMESFATDAYSMPAALHQESILYTVVLTVLFVFIAQLVILKRIKKLNWVEALSLKE